MPENVTCLIGITLNGRSKIGVIHKPYAENEESVNGTTYFGTPEIGVFKCDYNSDWDEKTL